MSRFLKNHGLFLTIIILAAFFRFWQIGNLPGGLFPDEAANGLDVNSILEGKLQPFYERGNGREALFFYVLALSVMLFGRGVWQHHIVSAGFGLGETILTYFLAKRLFNKRVALLSAFFMATSSYAVTLSRTAFRANTVPLFTILTLLFIVKFLQTTDRRTKLWSAAGAGASFALGFYTYISFRMMIPLLLVLAFGLLLSVRDRLKAFAREYGPHLAVGILVFIVLFAPLGYYFLSHPGSFVGRAGQVSIFSEDLNQGNLLGTFWRVFKQTIWGFFGEGDLNWRHNVSGFPFLSPFFSPFFAAGLLVFTFAVGQWLIQAWRKKFRFATMAKALVALLFWLMLVPEITTAEGIPHGLRLVGVIPVIFIIAAWAAARLWEWFVKLNFMDNLKYALAIIFFVGIFLYDFALYFGLAAFSPEYYYAFRSDLTVASEYLNQRKQKDKTYLSLDEFSVQTVEYLTTETGRPYTLVDPARTYEVELQSGDQVVFTQSTLFDRLKFLQSHPSAKLAARAHNQFGQIILLVYEQP